MPTRIERMGDVEEWIATESSRPLVRRALQRGALVTTFGTELDLPEYRTLIDRLASPGCMAGDDRVQDELLALRGNLKMELGRHLPTEVNRILTHLSEERLREMLARVVTVEAPCTFLLDAFAVEVGFADYRYWQVHITRPDIEEQRIIRPAAERLVVLPGTRQIYLRLVLRDPPKMGL
jgi:hypothetical protein